MKFTDEYVRSPIQLPIIPSSVLSMVLPRLSLLLAVLPVPSSLVDSSPSPLISGQRVKR